MLTRRVAVLVAVTLPVYMALTASGKVLGLSKGELDRLRKRAVEDPWEASDKEGRALISRIGSERATQGNGNKIVTFGGKTHVVWQDSLDRRYYAQIRTLDRATGQWSPTRTILRGRDNHSRPNMTIDSQGYLHVVMGGHQRVQYLRSVRPNDITEWTEPVEFPRNNTYPFVVCGPENSLYLTARHDAGWKGMDFYVKPEGKDWDYRGLLVRKAEQAKDYAAYHNGLAWGPGHRTLHLATGFYMGLGRPHDGSHQAVGYMRSHDFGNTWQKADGTPIELPATTETIDLLEEGKRDPEATDKPKPGIGNPRMASDSRGRVYVAYVRHTPKPGQSFLVTPDEQGRWQPLPMQQAVETNWPGRGAIRHEVSVGRGDVLCIVASLVPLEHPLANWSPGIGGRPVKWVDKDPKLLRIAWFESTDGGRSFSTRLVGGDASLLPTVEMATGFNLISGLPSVLYFVGQCRDTRKGETIDNDVYWADMEKAGR